jgi:hypothetical protein
MAKNINHLMDQVQEKPELSKKSQKDRERALKGDLEKNDGKNTKKKAGEPRKK